MALKVVAFDLYGTLLSTESVAAQLEQHFGRDQAQSISALWRRYQLEYTWRLNSMGVYESFSDVTRNSLRHALAENGQQLERREIDRLMDAYDSLSTFPDVRPALTRLASVPGVKAVVFSNGTDEMVSNSVRHSNDLAPHADLFAALVTVDEVQRYKPARATYTHLAQTVGKTTDQMDDLWLGIVYFASHRFLWPLFRARLLPIILLSLFIYTLLFLFAYLPQVAFLAIFQGATAWVSGAVLVLGEGAAIVAALFEAFFVDETLVDVFDAVLVNEGHEALVTTSRVLYPLGEDPVRRLGKPTISAIYAPFSLRQIFEFVVLLPLNLIPVAGVPMFLILTGYRAGPFHHWRYFQLLDLTKKQRKERIRHRQLQYTT
ncbi:hypothetical protein ASPZODRAFT_63075 [Penicilliopsis zonata CBS 506.65]|uniref:Haloacid dehalogenase, type II n=1 Tax=Penicilliopsis zonata CBS 506.65 TaxID=1073090 RepID=A0A1L9SKB4_9EURO|nr:hypothetical protein ASPZODRAFT_63075 [Penicilliopsis zonata CBS 506.65]OJJ47536.1 hypothetical protein ASPZODRAFT_63075 [Penicilliopsis zonata CBS 506.65]